MAKNPAQKLGIHSDPSGGEGSDLIRTKSLDVVDDARDVLESLEVGVYALSERGVPQAGVGDRARVHGKKGEVTVGKGGSGDVDSSIGPSGV